MMMRKNELEHSRQSNNDDGYVQGGSNMSKTRERRRPQQHHQQQHEQLPPNMNNFNSSSSQQQQRRRKSWFPWGVHNLTTTSSSVRQQESNNYNMKGKLSWSRSSWSSLVIARRLPSVLLVSGFLYFIIVITTTTTIQQHQLYGSSSNNDNNQRNSLLSFLWRSSSSSSSQPPTVPSPRSTTPSIDSTSSSSNSVRSNNQHSQTVPISSSSSSSLSSLQNATFRILCTSTNKKIEWGSYQIRCRDLKSWAERCCRSSSSSSSPSDGSAVGGVYVVTDLSFSDMYRRRWIRWWLNKLRPEETYTYDATIFVKSFPSLKRLLPSFGNNLFVDLVDEYGYVGDDIPTKYHLIAQTAWQGPEVFPNHKTSIVEHWYNSYPADMMLPEAEDDPKDIPVIGDDDNNNQPLRLATVWNTRREKEPTEGGCPTLSTKHQTTNVTYDCLDLEFDISKWYLKYIFSRRPQLDGGDINQQQQQYGQFQSTEEARVDMEATLQDPQLGPGKLYYNIFRNFDVLVVLTKNHKEKIRYGNVQRTISQMRSGVPVLVEIRGRVLHDFMSKYNYTCTFQRYLDNKEDDDSLGVVEVHNSAGIGSNNNIPTHQRQQQKKRKYWTFNEAVEEMKKVSVRRKCQRQGLNIARDYSPSKIGQKFLRTVGYKGDFVC
jgi:hypothetical protein